MVNFKPVVLFLKIQVRVISSTLKSLVYFRFFWGRHFFPLPCFMKYYSCYELMKSRSGSINPFTSKMITVYWFQLFTIVVMISFLYFSGLLGASRIVQYLITLNNIFFVVIQNEVVSRIRFWKSNYIRKHELYKNSCFIKINTITFKYLDWSKNSSWSFCLNLVTRGIFFAWSKLHVESRL